MTHYSTEIASTLSRASADAYRPKTEARMVGLNWQADDAEFIEEDDSTALLIADGNSLIVAHRGTQITSVTDWRNNLDLETGETLCGKVRLKGHAGFFAAWRAVFPWLWLRITHHRPRAVYVTGHSLGAPQAVLTAFALSREGLNVRGVYTFGSPRCFTHGSARRINRELGCHYRLTSGNDLVPRVPLPIRFRHCGQHVHLDRFCRERHQPSWLSLTVDRLLGYRGDLIADHSIFDYRRALGGGK
jgi:hypothetical protein